MFNDLHDSKCKGSWVFIDLHDIKVKGNEYLMIFMTLRVKYRCLMPLSTIYMYELNCGFQFYCWMKLE